MIALDWLAADVMQVDLKDKWRNLKKFRNL